MNNKSVSKGALRKRKEREMETVEERETRLSKDRKKKQKMIEKETKEQREERLKYQREKIKQRRAMQEITNFIGGTQQKSNNGDIQKNDNGTQQRSGDNDNIDVNAQQNINHVDTQQRFDVTELSKIDRKLLNNFRKKMDKVQNVFCPVCNECSPSIVLVMGKCRRCYSEKIMPHKFSAENNMDPGNVPDELQGMTEIEEMLIAKVFTVMSVYRLRGGQYGYRGNVINFPQDVERFTTQLPRDPSSLEVLIV